MEADGCEVVEESFHSAEEAAFPSVTEKQRVCARVCLCVCVFVPQTPTRFIDHKLTSVRAHCDSLKCKK